MSDWNSATDSRSRTTWIFLVVLGLFLTFRGYRSLEGDQAYRLPLLLNQQDSATFGDDPFVQAFRDFNPHRGSLALLDLVSRPLGLMAGLCGLFLLTFGLTFFGVNRLGRAVSASGATGLWAAALVLMFAQAGNIGTNHLFEPILLDRLMAFSLGWWAIALAVEDPSAFSRRACPLVGLATLIHPSIGLQIAIILGATWVGWRLLGMSPGVEGKSVVWGLIALGLSVLPGLAINLGQPGQLLEGLTPTEFRLLSVELQSPQHMLPHLWRMPQWLAWFCYPILAALSLLSMRKEANESTPSTSARDRLLILLVVNFAFLLVAYVGVEIVQNLRLTVFQPFRMATLARGLCLIFVAEHCRRLWGLAGVLSRLRILWMAVGLVNDWSLVVVTLTEIGLTAADRSEQHSDWKSLGCWVRFASLALFAGGILYLKRHDTESGHFALIGVTAVWLAIFPIRALRTIEITPRRRIRWLAACWLIPVAALAVNLTDQGLSSHPAVWRNWLVKRCRFAAVPLDDMERLAAWCRDHTPEEARFIGPPGPKSFRLWSKRNLAFNRASSPYHAVGLDDWSRRFMEHVGFTGSRRDFVAAYLRNRQALESGYDAMSGDQLAKLAARNEARFVVAASPESHRGPATTDGLELVHAEGSYAVYRAVTPPVRNEAIAAERSKVRR